MLKPTKRILVAGGAGFLGSHLCEYLIEHGHRVLCLDNFSSGSEANLAGLLDHPHFEIVRHDITKPIQLEVDEIYNLACPASPLQYQKNPLQTIRTNILGTIHLLDLAVATGAKILQASTSEVYGDPQIHPQTEAYWGNVNPIGPRSCYDEGKRCAETLFFDYHRQYQIPIKVARIFNTYGPRMLPDDGRVISNFMVQALAGQPLTLFGDGSQTRSFCYVDDLIEGLVRLMATPAVVLGPVNLGNPEENTILDLARGILALTGSEVAIRFLPLPADDPQRRNPDIDLARELLDWEPAISLEQGLVQTLAFFASLPAAERDAFVALAE